VALPVSRAYFALGGIKAGAEPATARCIASRITSSLTLAELQTLMAGEAPDKALEQRAAAAGAACR
jgi:hypothetical protein